MSDALAVIGPINTAIRLKKAIMESKGCTPNVVHTPAVINEGGCSYSLKFNEQYIPIVNNYANKLNIFVKGFYIESDMKGEKEYYVVS